VSKKPLVLAAFVVCLFASARASADPAKPATRAAQDGPAAGASAPKHHTARAFQLQLMGGFCNAQTESKAHPGPVSVGLGAGVRAGYTLPRKVYLGASFKMNYRADDIRYFTVVSTFYRPGLDVGYDLAAGPAVIRPYVGGGIAARRFDIVKPETTNSDGDMNAAAWGGLQLLGVIPKTPLLVGADLSTFVTADDLTLHPVDVNVVVAARF